MSKLREALRDLPEPVFADLLESDDAYLLVIDLPGAGAETTDVSVERGRLALEARREKAPDREFSYVEEDRPLFLDAEIPLPPDATHEGSEAEMERGVLSVRLPKRAAAPEHEITVTDADA
ncbi:Hsp20/alpha crystallin family protein [Halobaculum rubrum]|uniref:Hsp20/alpha crystallin family protein n=1 Tax=Halobaculum rubrum TaxID=2872158 RepID=UPI001CA43ED1|nr:Hsp20/alpha crystallin family protein [Halobaculum rubrum]QZX98502.1 Hsp20/alpha crystallin family protein [Halobaculum rubrum]